MARMHPFFLSVLTKKDAIYTFTLPFDTMKGAEAAWRALPSGYGFKEAEVYRVSTPDRASKAFQNDIKKQVGAKPRILKKLPARRYR